MAINIDSSILNAFCNIGKKYGIKKIVLFGSRARGDHRYNSDIDVAFYLKDEKIKV